MICVGTTKSSGSMCSCNDPTALNAKIMVTPSDLRAAMLARLGTSEGRRWCPFPCRARKATGNPDGDFAIVMGEEGYPHGVSGLTVSMVSNLSSL